MACRRGLLDARTTRFPDNLLVPGVVTVSAPKDIVGKLDLGLAMPCQVLPGA